MARGGRSPVLTVQVDVDTVGSLLRFYGFDAPRSTEDPVYRLALPRFAALFDVAGVRATFFVVGEDLIPSANRDVVRRLHAAGHEIANHTHRHDYHFLRSSRLEKREEIARAGEMIERATGEVAVGFRAPGYGLDEEVLDALTELGYRYDASVMPSVLTLPMKVCHWLLSGQWNGAGYGRAALSVAPNRPYRPAAGAIWRAGGAGSLWELPVTCVPYLRLPFYAHFNLFTGDPLFRLSAALAAGMDCNYVFHGVEMLDPRELDPRIRRHPNARLPLPRKRARCRAMLEALRSGRRPMVSRDFVAELTPSAAGGPCRKGAGGPHGTGSRVGVGGGLVGPEQCEHGAWTDP
jgi:hypothetical protein